MCLVCRCLRLRLNLCVSLCLVVRLCLSTKCLCVSVCFCFPSVFVSTTLCVSVLYVFACLFFCCIYHNAPFHCSFFSTAVKSNIDVSASPSANDRSTAAEAARPLSSPEGGGGDDSSSTGGGSDNKGVAREAFDKTAGDMRRPEVFASSGERWRRVLLYD